MSACIPSYRSTILVDQIGAVQFREVSRIVSDSANLASSPWSYLLIARAGFSALREPRRDDLARCFLAPVEEKDRRDLALSALRWPSPRSSAAGRARPWGCEG